jgi:hypothetical protein
MSTIKIQKGNPYTATITITNSNGTPYSLTAKTVLFTVKDKVDYADNDDAALITQNITSHTNAEGGITTLSLTGLQTNITRGIYKADIRVYSSEGTQVNCDTFNCEITDIVTKRVG